MPISEKTFADRLGRGREMHAAIALFAPPFAPADVSLLPPAFNTFLDDLDTSNTDTGTLGSSYTTNVDERTDIVKDIKDRALRVLSYVESNSAWISSARGIKTLVDKIRGVVSRPAKAPAPGETPSSPQARRRRKGEQSYGDIAANLERLIAALQTIAGYAPPASELTVASLTTLATGYSALNTSMATLAQQAGRSQRDRLDGYDGPDGLSAKMKAIKKAARAQYGTASGEYAAVKSIRI